MTPDTRQARFGHRRLPVRQAASGTTVYPGALAAGPTRTAPSREGAPPVPADAGMIAHGARSSSSARTRTAARRAREDAKVVKVIPFLAVVIATVAGVYIAWEKGSAGGGEGGVIGGAALIAAAIARLLLPTRLVGLLAVRKRTIDVITLAVFGTCLLVAGLVLPR